MKIWQCGLSLSYTISSSTFNKVIYTVFLLYQCLRVCKSGYNDFLLLYVKLLIIIRDPGTWYVCDGGGGLGSGSWGLCVQTTGNVSGGGGGGGGGLLRPLRTECGGRGRGAGGGGGEGVGVQLRLVLGRGLGPEPVAGVVVD